VAYAIRAGLGRSEVVAIEKAPRTNNYLVVSGINCTTSQEIQVYEIDYVKTGQFQSPTGFKLTIDTMTGRDKSLNRYQYRVTPASGRPRRIPARKRKVALRGPPAIQRLRMFREVPIVGRGLE
jgi:hypothetical protein